MVFFSIQQHLIRDICANFGMPNLPQSTGTEQGSDQGISDFRISGQSFIKENYHTSRISGDIGMKCGAVTKIDEKNKTTSKK